MHSTSKRKQVEQQLEDGAKQAGHEYVRQEEAAFGISATFYTACAADHQQPRVRARGEHRRHQQGTTRARRCKPGRRRSAAVRSGGDSDPPGDSDGELVGRLLALVEHQDVVGRELAEMLDEAIAELAELAVELDDARGDS
jgi:hypothetical protein